MKKHIHILFLIICSNAISQEGNITVKYDLILDDTKDIYGGMDFKKATLITNGKESLYTEKNIDTTIVFASGDDISFNKSDVIFNYSKDLMSKIIIYKDRYVGMNFTIKDGNYAIKWTITDNYKKVMGYSCQEATGKFGCRTYKAYFLKEIPYRDGPYKFDGLPGIILEILSDDGAVKISANEIISDRDLLPKPFKESHEFISYDQAMKKYQLKFDKITNAITEEGSSVTIPKKYIECYVE